MDSTATNDALMSSIILMILSLLFSAIVYVWLAFALSKVFAKVGQPAWKAWVPVMNIITVFQLGGVTPLWAIAFLVPLVNIAGLFFLLVAINNINKRFGFGIGYTIIAWVALPVWASILGFGAAQWQGSPPVLGATTWTGFSPSPQSADAAGATAYQDRVGSMVPPVPPAPATSGPPSPKYPAPKYPAPTAQPAYAAPQPPAPTFVAPPVAQPAVAHPPVPPVPPVPSAAPAEPALVVPGSIADSLGPQVPAAEVAAEPDSSVADEQPDRAASDQPDEISAAQNNAARTIEKAPVVETRTAGDPWAPPISSIPGVANSAPANATARPPVAPITPPPASAPTPAPALPESALVTAPPAAPPAAPPVPPVVPAAVTPPPAPVVPPVPELLPDFDDTIIADDLPDFDDTVIVGRKNPVWILEPGGSKAIRITSPVALLGRNPSVNAAYPDAQLVLVPDPSKTMSKNHARIALDDGVWTIHDLGSTNGVVLVSDGEETVLESGSSATLTETFKLGELPIRLTPEL